MAVDLFADDITLFGGAWSTLGAGISSGAVSLTVGSNTGYPAADPTAVPATQFRVRIDNELFTVTDNRTTTWTVTPGTEGSTQSAHSSGATVTPVITSGVLSALLGRTPGWLDIRDYGAKCDLRVSEAGVTVANGSTSATITDAHFTSADVGKQIYISQGVSSTVGLKTTISAVTDATHVTLANAVSVAVSAKSALWGTDDTVAIQAALDDAYNRANTEPAGGGGPGVVYFPGWSYVNGAVNPGSHTNNNSVLCVPSSPITYTGGTVSGSQRQPTVTIKGVGGCTESYSTIAPTMGGSGVFCPTSGANTNQSIIGGGYIATAGTFFALDLRVEDFNVCTINNPSLVGIDGLHLNGLVVRNVAVGLGIPRNESTAGGSTFGIRFPAALNGATSCRAEGTVIVHRFDGGILTGEHFENVGTILLQGGTNGLSLSGGGAHAQHLGCIVLQQWSGSLINTSGSGPLIVTCDQIRAEMGSATWFVNDSSNLIRGTIPFVAANTYNDAPPVNGAANVKLLNEHVPHGTFTAPAVPSSTTAATKVYRDMAVSVSGGTVTAITVDGTATGLTSGTVIVPSGKTIAITYSVAPTWVWMAL